MNKELITVIVPVYNVEKYLSKCIDSILNQTYTNLEIILVDDGSQDDCGQICDEYARKDNRIKVIHKENSGVSQARNIGIDNANGEFIAFVDADDYIEREMLYTLKNNIKNVDLSSCGSQKVLGNNIIEQFKLEKDVIIDNKEFMQSMFYGRKHKYKYQGLLVDKLYKSDIIRNNNIRFQEEIKYNEDRLFVFQYINKCDEGVYISSYMGYNYFQRDNSAMHQKEYKNDMYTEFIAFDKMSEIAREKKEVEIDDGIRAEYIIHALEIYMQYYDNSKNEINEYKEIAVKYIIRIVLSTNISFSVKWIIIKKYLKTMLKYSK